MLWAKAGLSSVGRRESEGLSEQVVVGPWRWGIGFGWKQCGACVDGKCLGYGSLALLREEEKPVGRRVKVGVWEVWWVAEVITSGEDCGAEHEWKVGFLLRPGLSKV